ncbi:uncharacterized protein JN550_009810 [Neoarthrinium moseri]|uniref:uncharacterized protein n=1 Tax=Neoarthrinium moseri TaxID=1658444 RepID=UPI001FDD8253|nr:uncharacterized protein JN550_009810 [Neoarthrinium moseri]KAI1863074.1 hypothetical protein JN550_009810 [Neoarthrinium moseri]
MGCGASLPASDKGKNFAPQGITRPVYRGTGAADAMGYILEDNPGFITTKRPGDFHRQNVDSAAYFTFDKEYARSCRPPAGKIIRQDIPREMLHSNKAYKFDDVPTDDWRRFVEANRRQERIQQGKMRKVQHMDIIEGPVSDTSTKNFTKDQPPIPAARFKPARNQRGDEYVQQIAFKNHMIQEVARLPKRLTD